MGNIEKMTLLELKLIRESLQECHPDVRDFSWGPTLSMAQKRRETALKLIRRAIKETKNDTNRTCTVGKTKAKADFKSAAATIGLDRIDEQMEGERNEANL